MTALTPQPLDTDALAAAYATIRNLHRTVHGLRASIENAPHDAGCDMRLSETIRIPEDKCTCWKADAL